MADTKFSDADNLDNDALLRQLGGGGVKAPKVLGTGAYAPALGAASASILAKQPVSTTMPVTTPAAADPRDPTRTSANAPRVRQDAQGNWQLTEHGNTRDLQGNEVADATRYADQFWQDNPTGWQANNPSTMGDVYRQVLGRDPDAEGLAAHAKNPGGFGGAINTILGSEEAQQRRTAPPITNLGLPGATTPPAAGATPPAAGATPPAAGERRGSWGNLRLDAPTQTNLNQFHGYNDERALAGSDDDSTKDALRRWLGGQNYSLAGQTKEQIDAHFESQLEAARAYGLDIRDIQGDKMLINTRERGPEWIDFVEGAGGANPAFAYQSDYDNAGGAAAQTNAASAPSLVGGALQNVINGGDGEKTAQQKIQDEIEALMAGKGSPVDRDALLEQLQG
jgi:hypothetical protein